MNFDLKNNNYMLSLLAGILGTVISLVIDKVSDNDDNKKSIDYMKYVKILFIISVIVLGVTMFLKSDNKTLNGRSAIAQTNILTETELPNTGGLEEVNMNQKIHTGNPQF